MKHRYHLLNVFTRNREPLSGNPLCVFEAGAGLSDALMQALARQFNLSETTFILPSARATAQVRIFTPDFELPFAGHPTLGTSHVVRLLAATRGEQLSKVTLEMRAGVIPVVADGDRWTLQSNAATHRDIDCTRDELAVALGIASDDIIWQPSGARPLWIDTGTEQLLVPLRSTAAVRAVAIRAGERAPPRNNAGQRMALVFSADGADSILARFHFESAGAFLEDPATGSACAALGGWYLATGSPVPLTRVVSQGEQVRRPSTLRLSVGADQAIRVAGDVVYLGTGELRLD